MFSVFHYIFEFLFFNNFIGIFKNKKSKIIYGGMEIDEDYGQFVDLDETF